MFYRRLFGNSGAHGDWHVSVVSRRTEDRLDERRVCRPIRAQDEDVPRPCILVTGHELKDSVSYHLQLAARRVAGVNLHVNRPQRLERHLSAEPHDTARRLALVIRHAFRSRGERPEEQLVLRLCAFPPVGSQRVEVPERDRQLLGHPFQEVEIDLRRERGVEDVYRLVAREPVRKREVEICRRVESGLKVLHVCFRALLRQQMVKHTLPRILALRNVSAFPLAEKFGARDQIVVIETGEAARKVVSPLLYIPHARFGEVVQRLQPCIALTREDRIDPPCEDVP